MRRYILNFHGLGEPARTIDDPDEGRFWLPPELFEEILDLVEARRDRVDVSYTFDDGNRSDLEIGAEALARRQRTATFFVLASRIGEPGSLDPADLRALIAEGNEIGNHGADHVSWRNLDETRLDQELGQARERIAEAAGRPVVAAAIPFGQYRGRVLRRLRHHGYERVYCVDGGPWTSDQYPIARTSITNTMTAADVEQVLLGRNLGQGARRVVARAYKRR